MSLPCQNIWATNNKLLVVTQTSASKLQILALCTNGCIDTLCYYSTFFFLHFYWKPKAWSIGLERPKNTQVKPLTGSIVIHQIIPSKWQSTIDVYLKYKNITMITQVNVWFFVIKRKHGRMTWRSLRVTHHTTSITALPTFCTMLSHRSNLHSKSWGTSQEGWSSTKLYLVK